MFAHLSVSFPSRTIKTKTNQRRLDHEYQIHPIRGLLHPGSEATGGNPAHRQMGPYVPESPQRTPPNPVQQLGSVRQPLDIPSLSKGKDHKYSGQHQTQGAAHIFVLVILRLPAAPSGGLPGRQPPGGCGHSACGRSSLCGH